MKYVPFSSIESTKFRSTLFLARILTTLGIAGFYISLCIAGYFYLSQSGSSAASSNANQVLLNGVMTSFSLLGIGCLLALIIIAEKRQRQQKKTTCPLVPASENS